MRAKKIEKLLSYAGNEHRYQYFVLFIFLFLWANCNFMAVVLPYLEREPLINYYDAKGNFHEKEALSSDKCSYKYKIIEKFGYSWVNEFNIECDKFKIGLIGVFTFIGNTLGSIVFCIVQKYISHKKILVISSGGFIISIFLSTLINNIEYIYYLYLCLIFVGMFGNCLCYSSLVICQEIISSNKRSLFSSIINMGYGLCGIIYSFIFMYVQNWRYDFYILIGLSLFDGILICIFVHDSPRIYIDNGEIEKLNKILECVACFNGLKKEFLEKSKSEEYKQLS
jgi:MFS family permease